MCWRAALHIQAASHATPAHHSGSSMCHCRAVSPQPSMAAALAPALSRALQQRSAALRRRSVDARAASLAAVCSSRWCAWPEGGGVLQGNGRSCVLALLIWYTCRGLLVTYSDPIPARYHCVACGITVCGPRACMRASMRNDPRCVHKRASMLVPAQRVGKL